MQALGNSRESSGQREVDLYDVCRIPAGLGQGRAGVRSAAAIRRNGATEALDSPIYCAEEALELSVATESLSPSPLALSLMSPG